MPLFAPASLPSYVFPTLGSTGAAATNSTVIQTALTAGGEVHLVGSGIAYISTTLVIGANTRLVVDPRLTIKATSTLNSQLMVTACYNRVFASASLSWLGGLLVTLTLTAHGLLSGDAVWVRGTPGTTDSAYFGIFTVRSVTNANVVIIILRRQPSAVPSGTIEAKRADSNVTLQGGLWNYNNSGGNSGAPDGPGRFAVIFAGVRGLVMEDVRGTDGQKFLFALGGVSQFECNRCFGYDTFSDIFKIYGPAFDGIVNNVTGDAGDDMATLQCHEVAPYAQYDYTGGGDLLAIRISDIHGKTPTRICSLYPDPNFRADAIEFDNIGGEPAVYAVGIVGPSGGGSNIGTIRLTNIDWMSGVNYPIINVDSADIDHLIIDGVLGDVTTAATYLSDVITIGGSTIRKLDVKRFRGNPAAGGSAYYGLAITGGSVVDSVTLEDWTVVPASGAGMRVAHVGANGGAAVVKQFTIVGNNLKNLDSLLIIDAGITAPLVVAQNNRIDTIGSIVSTLSACTLVASGNVLTNVYYGAIRTEGVAVTLKAFGNTNSLGTAANAWFTRVNGNEAVTVIGEEIQVDATTIARTNGSYCYNTNAAAGTLATAGVIDCDSTATTGSWHKRTNPALVY